MEKERNNALEKVENAIENKTAKAHIKEQKKQDRERLLAEKRLEDARRRMHENAEKQKAKATALREKNRRKAESKERKQLLKAERQERRDLIKKESKKEKAQRLAVERQARRDARQRRRKENRGLGGWITAVVTLSIATLVLSSVLTATFLMPSENDNLLEASYQKSFYDAVAEIDNVDLNLSKVLVTDDTGAMQKYLVDTAINSELAENSIQQLPLHDESKFYTTKLINQIGDYSKYLNNKLIMGEKLSASDIESLNGLYQANKTLKESFQKMIGKMGSDYSFTAHAGMKADIMVEGFDELQNLSVQYPELIYDGPFSDGQTNREIKGLDGAEIDDNYAREVFKKIFADYGIDKVENVGVADGDIKCFNVQAQVEEQPLYAQISKTGGKLIMFSYGGSCLESVYNDDVAIEKAEEFLSSLGITDMKPVWINLSNNVYTINFAYEKQGVIVYSDLIKIRVCAQTAMVIGLEASSYYTNHVERVIEKPTLTKTQAKSKVSSNIEIDTCRLAVVPVGTSTEKLCYECMGEYDGSTYYVYIDAKTGRQVEMFKVIESTEGSLLL